MRPAGPSLDLDSLVSLSLAKGGFSFEARAPCALRVGEGGASRAPGDLELALRSAFASRGLSWALGASLALPTGRDPRGAGGAAGGTSPWRAGASLEAARLLDPLVAAARARAELLLPRRGAPGGAGFAAGIGLSLAEALNSRASIALAADLAATLERGGARFSGGSGVAFAWGDRPFSAEAGLSCGLGEGAARGPSLALGLAYSLGWGGGP